MRSFEDRVAVITGAASGIGRATAHAAAAAGMRVVLADIEAEPLRRAEAELSGRGARVSARVTDVRSGAELGELAELTLRTHGRVDLVHNNAGSSSFASCRSSPSPTGAGCST